MLTYRDLAVAAMAIAGTLGAVQVASVAKPILGPTVYHFADLKVTKTDVGEVRSLVRQPTATVDELEMHITTLNPGKMSHPPHQHVNEELILMDKGECETLSNGKWITVGPGDVVFNASGSLHGFRNVGTVPATYHVVNWSPNKDLKPAP